MPRFYPEKKQRRVLPIQEVLNEFKIICSLCKTEPIGTGLINKVYHVTNSDKKKEDYLLQRVNAEIFRDAKVLMFNISLLMQHVFFRNLWTSYETINQVLTRDGAYCYRDSDGFYWRAFRIPGREKFQKIKSFQEYAYSWARLFGLFLSYLDEFPVRSPSKIDFLDLETMRRIQSYKSNIFPPIIRARSTPINEVDYVFRLMRQISIMDETFNKIMHADSLEFSSSQFQ